jgi:hypothetical protein
MSPKLSDDQRHALEAEHDAPVFVFDDQRHMTYVLVSLREYERVRPLFDETEFPVRESYPLQNAVASAGGWDQPNMDAYARLVMPKPTP